MGALNSFVAALVLLTEASNPAVIPAPQLRAPTPPTVPPPRPNSVARWRAEMVEASARFGVPTLWIEHVIRAESSGETLWKGLPITSRAGAMGLMQLMPATWAAMRAAWGLGADPYDPRDNILAGTAYLRAMYDRFGYPGLFAAYNAGPGRYQTHLTSGQPLPAETRAYLVKVAGSTDNSPDFAGRRIGSLPAVSSPVVAETGQDRDRPKRLVQGLFVGLHGDASPDEDEMTGARSKSKEERRDDRLFAVQSGP